MKNNCARRAGQEPALACITVNSGRALPAARSLRAQERAAGRAAAFRMFFACPGAYRGVLRRLAADGPSACLAHLYPGRGEPCSAQSVSVSGLKNLAPVLCRGRQMGFAGEDDYARYCLIGGVVAPDLRAGRPEQAGMVFETMKEMLTRHGFAFADTVRTWFFNDRITDWYGKFNTVRSNFFSANGVFDRLVPASTGIGAGNPYGAALAGSLLAVQSRPGLVRAASVDSPLQAPALNYRSSFSRAVELVHPLGRLLIVSGTASIGQDGGTLHKGDASAQVGRAMRVATELLKARRMQWENVLRGVVYCKGPGPLRHFLAYCRRHGIAGGRMARAFTDLCRDDLLFEIELDAFQPAGRATVAGETGRTKAGCAFNRAVVTFQP